MNCFTAEIINMIIEWGPCQPVCNDLPNKIFPKSNDGRSFHANWYFMLHPDGTQTKRYWLSYSPSIDKIFCLDCILFGRKTAKAWVKDGFSHWKNGSIAIISYETSTPHVIASMKLKMKQSVLPLMLSLD